MSREDIYGGLRCRGTGDDPLLTLLNDNQTYVSRQKVERDLQSVVEVLDNPGL